MPLTVLFNIHSLPTNLVSQHEVLGVQVLQGLRSVLQCCVRCCRQRALFYSFREQRLHNLVWEKSLT